MPQRKQGKPSKASLNWDQAAFESRCMATDDKQTLTGIWRQNVVPVVFKRERPQSLLIKLPFEENNMEWLRNGRHNKPVWSSQYHAWQVPQKWFEETIKQCVSKYARCYVVQCHRERQICAPACWSANGMHCECSCMGENHGTGHPGGRWYEIDETLAVSWEARKYAYRLVRAK